MIGLRITAWAGLPLEEVVLWLTVTLYYGVGLRDCEAVEGLGQVAAHAILG